MSTQLKPIVDRLLSGVSSAYIPKNYVSEQVLPMIQSVNSNGKLGNYGSDHLRIENTIKGGRGKYRQVQPITRGTDSFSIDGHGLEGMVTKEDYANLADPFDAESDEVMGISTILWLEKEYALASTLTSSSIITQYDTLSGTGQWSDFANSDPIANCQIARSTIVDSVGMMPNGVIMDIKVFNCIRFHPAFLEAMGFKYSKPGGLNIADLAIAMGVDQIFLADARYNSAKEGQTAVMLPVWGKDVVFGVFPPSAQKYQTSVGYMVRYVGDSPRQVYKQPNFNPPGSTSILVEDNYDMLISKASAAYLWKAVIA